MGILDEKHLITLVCVLVANVLGSCCCAWIFRFVYKGAVEAVARTRGKSQMLARIGGNDDALCPCLLKRFTSTQIIMAITLTSIGCFAMACVAQCVLFTIMLATCYNHQCWPLSAEYTHIFWSVFSTGAFIFMFVAHFERLRKTFRGTTHELPHWAPRVLYVMVVIGVLARTLMYIQVNNTLVRSLCAIVLIALYFASVCGLIVAFFRKAMAVVKSAGQRTDSLANAAVRITICVTVSLLSSTVSFLIVAVITALCVHCIMPSLILLTVDMCLNAFCLMCTLSRSERYYQPVFGKLHSLFLRRVSPVCDASDTVDSGLLVSVTKEPTDIIN